MRRIGLRSGTLAACLLATLCTTGAIAQSERAQTAVVKPATAATMPQRKVSPYRPPSVTQGARNYYAVTSGVDNIKVRRTNAGNLIRFSYRVTNPDQAKALADKQAKPMLIGHQSRAVLSVPVMDKVGQLRQTTKLEQGKEYWMVFSNKGDVVKPGERVSVVIGKFRADGLRVE